MDASPRIVLADVTMTWDGVPLFVRHGSMVSAPPGSSLETAYGGPGNLRMLTAGERGDPECSNRASQHN
jgi:hypothetical protein